MTDCLREKNVLAVRVLAGGSLGEPVFGWTVLPCALAAQPRHVRDAAQSVLGQREPFGLQKQLFSQRGGHSSRGVAGEHR